MMSALYEEKGASLRIEILEAQEVSDFIDTHTDILNSSFKAIDMSDVMRKRLMESNWIFSGMKTFHELNEAFPSLLDENGNRKPFEQFLRDVQKIDSTYNKNYLNAEYNFAQASSEMAGKWEEFTKGDDDYYLQYRTAGDDKVRPEHAALNGVTLSASDDFWDKYYPPNGWNCRCTVVQVLKDDYPATIHDEAMRRGREAIPDERESKMFAFNPGKQEKTFPDYNPYTLSKCLTCDKTNMGLAFVPDNEVCQACAFVRKCYVGKEIEYVVGKGMVKISRLINTNSPDYSKLVQIAEHFAAEGAIVEMTPKMSRPADFLYDCYYKDLRGTKYYGKCPDMRIKGVWYEHEGFISDNPKNAFRNMLHDGLLQSERLIIDRPELSRRYMMRSIIGRISRGEDIKEVWLRNPDGTIELLYKKRMANLKGQPPQSRNR